MVVILGFAALPVQAVEVSTRTAAAGASTPALADAVPALPGPADGKVWSWQHRTGQLPQLDRDSPLSLTSGRSRPRCGSKTTCAEMNSCEEAMYFLNQCGQRRLDRDGDGIPCESGPC